MRLPSTMKHIVLLGDSVFDNAAYTGGEPDVVSHLRALAPGWHATLCAVDGATTVSLSQQIPTIPQDGTDLVVSIGGNDVLGHWDLLSTPVRSTADALALFGRRVSAFEATYRRGLAPLIALQKPTVVCTIYNGNLPDPVEAALARVALTMFNDVIVRVALEQAAELIDLRLVCTEAADYANPIEPSGPGGRKIAAAIVRAIRAPSAGGANT
jgi:GDSL-like Lipase/Acylhydrolase family